MTAYVVLLSMLVISTQVSDSMAVSLKAKEGALSTDAVENLKERPVMKVVRMLQDMKAELEKELEDDKAVHEMLDCWCKTNREEKTKAIEVGEAKAADLEASMSEAAAKVKELKIKRKSTQEQMYADQKALGEATALRMKENQAFQDDSNDLIGAIDACKQAIVVLSKHNPQLAQLKTVAHLLQTAKVADLVMHSHSVARVGLSTLKDFLKNAQTASSFLAIPGFQSYAPQSGQIYGILQQMQEDFEGDLSEAQAAEKKAAEDFAALKAAKEEEIASAERLIVQLDQEIADLGEKAAQEAKELADVQQQLEYDKAFLADLEKKCAESAEEFDTRVKSRLEEISAVEDAIKILNADESFNVFDKTVNTAFVQVSSVAAQQESQTMQTHRKQATAVLRQAAGRLGDPKLALLATSVQLDTFTQVKAEIDKLVAELSQQQKDEIAHRDSCTDDFAENDRETAKADDKQTNLETKIADLEQAIKSLTEDIEATTKVIAETQEQMKRRSETREAENADYQQTITDQTLTQAILQKALARMQEVYALLQQEPSQPGAAHIATSGTHTDAGNGPARFKEYAQNAGGKRVVAMLEEVIADSKKMQDEAQKAEEDAQEAYEDFMKSSNEAIILGTKRNVDNTEAKAKASASLTMAKTDLKQTIEDLAGLNAVKGDLHKSCDYLMKNFQVRQEAREAEIQALKEAKAILSGMN